MSEYVIKDGIVFQQSLNFLKPLSAREIFDKQVQLKSENLKFSKISIEPSIRLYFINSKIMIKLCCKKNEIEYDVKIINNKYLDYIIIHDCFYYLIFDESNFDKIIEKMNIKLDSELTFYQYLNLKAELKKNDFIYLDDINQELSQTRKYSPNEIINSEIKGKLFEYQNIGFNWLSFMYRNNCGAILADEMGLGKTLQIISLMAYLKHINAKSHFLVACPLSLLENWKREINKFSLNLTVLVHHGPNRTGSYLNLLQYDVVITSYSNIQSDLSMFNMIEWDLFIVDEAQNIKNPIANRTKLLKQVNTKCSIAVTGTPFENHLEDIWSIIDFVLPNYLGSLNSFKKEYSDDVYSAERIEPIISPLMLRRKVVDVANDLPQKIEIPQPIIMEEQEALLYEGNRKKSLESLSELKIDKIQKLRLFCTHPFVYQQDNLISDPFLVSSKYQRLCEIMEEIVMNNEKALVFTSFNKMNDILIKDLNNRFGIPTFSITGSTKVDDRQIIIDDFSKNNGSAVLVLNPKAAGSGLNITAANHVIHYNLEWNPAVEDQASARSYRKGQDKPVFIYRLFYVGTIEEIIDDRITRKRGISNVAIVGNQGNIEKEDLERALSISPIGG